MIDFFIMNSRNVNSDEFICFYNMLDEGLPENEHRSFDNQKALLNVLNYNIIFMKSDKSTVAVAAVWQFEDFCYIEHLIVNKALRSQGFGGKMLEFIKQKFSSVVILEVEPPYNELNKKRISFYTKNGFFINDFEYYQLPLNLGDKKTELKLMSFPRALDLKVFEAVKNQLYKSVYKAQI